jgi:hypothetical protein
MDHTQFKANQTAAGYVADGLDESTQEAFELHMMACPDCVEDVETWRAIKINMPRKARPALAPAAVGRHVHAAAGWRMAASLLIGGLVGVAGGWFGRSAQGPDLDSTQTVFFNVSAVARGVEDCTPLRLARDTKVAVLRVPGVSADRRVIALDSEKRELPGSGYAVRLQPDGSQLARIDTQLLDGRAVHLEARGADGSSEPLGCITGEVTTAARAPTP